jgi:hypothetical protein
MKENEGERGLGEEGEDTWEKKKITRETESPSP